MARRKEARYTTLFIQDGTGGTGAVDDSGLVATDTDMGIDTLSMNDTVTLVGVGTRFTTAGIPAVRNVTVAQNSQQWTLTIDATGGTYTLTLNAETTAAIAFDATSATVLTAVELLSSITAGDVTITGDDPHTITMAGTTFKNTSTNTLTANAASLTGGASTAVVAVVRTGLVTWNITFTPAIVAGSVPADDDVITWLPARVEIKPDGDGTANWTEAQDPQVRTSRGILDGSTAGTEVPMQFNTAILLDFFRASSGGALTPYEALWQIGEAADWLTTAGLVANGSFCEPYSVDIVLVDEPPCGSELAEMTFIRGFLMTEVSPTLEDSQIEIAGICTTVRSENFRVANNADAIGAQA